MKTDTIAAIATAMTNSGIGIVRMSGDEAFEIIQKIYIQTGQDIKQMPYEHKIIFRRHRRA